MRFVVGDSLFFDTVEPFDQNVEGHLLWRSGDILPAEAPPWQHKGNNTTARKQTRLQNVFLHVLVSLKASGGILDGTLADTGLA